MVKLLKLCGVALAVAAPVSQASAERIFGLTTGNSIVTFDSSDPSIITSTGAISGLGGAVLTGIDLRPANRVLYSVATNGNLYSITKNASGVDYTANLIGVTTFAPNGTDFGIDFNPVPDRIRFVSNTNQNLRINPNDAVTLNDGAITLDGSSNVDLLGVAYTNSRPGVTSTVLYGIDSVSDRLVRSTNPNGGVFVTTNLAGEAFGPLGIGVSNNNFVGFDISGATGAAFFAVDSALFGLDLGTGRSTFLGVIDSGTLIGITAGAVPEPATWGLMIAGFGMVGMAARRRKAMATIAA